MAIRNQSCAMHRHEVYVLAASAAWDHHWMQRHRAVTGLATALRNFKPCLVASICCSSNSVARQLPAKSSRSRPCKKHSGLQTKQQQKRCAAHDMACNAASHIG